MSTIAAVRRQRPAVYSGRQPHQERIAVGLIEDHRLVRERLTDFLNRQPGLQVVVSVAASPQGLERLQTARPQVVVIDVAAGTQASHDCLQRVRGLLPEARIVMMNVPPSQEDLILFIEQGAGGLLLQDATVDEFVETVKKVSGGTNMLPQSLVPLIFSGLAHPATTGHSPGNGKSTDRLTARERKVVQLVAEGLPNQAIADHLAISVHTVKTHVHSVLAKLGLQSRLQIAVHVHTHSR